ncbi:MAG TPA: hypothetical protein VNE17_14750 [Nitrolancea sp.]|nr:hypothetical protein [Nitrolancea sp.]
MDPRGTRQITQYALLRVERSKLVVAVGDEHQQLQAPTAADQQAQ